MVCQLLFFTLHKYSMLLYRPRRSGSKMFFFSYPSSKINKMQNTLSLMQCRWCWNHTKTECREYLVAPVTYIHFQISCWHRPNVTTMWKIVVYISSNRNASFITQHCCWLKFKCVDTKWSHNGSFNLNLLIKICSFF